MDPPAGERPDPSGRPAAADRGPPAVKCSIPRPSSSVSCHENLNAHVCKGESWYGNKECRKFGRQERLRSGANRFLASLLLAFLMNRPWMTSGESTASISSFPGAGPGCASPVSIGRAISNHTENRGPPWALKHSQRRRRSGTMRGSGIPVNEKPRHRRGGPPDRIARPPRGRALIEKGW